MHVIPDLTSPVGSTTAGSLLRIHTVETTDTCLKNKGLLFFPLFLEFSGRNLLGVAKVMGGGAAALLPPPAKARLTVCYINVQHRFAILSLPTVSDCF